MLKRRQKHLEMVDKLGDKCYVRSQRRRVIGRTVQTRCSLKFNTCLPNTKESGF